MLKNLTLLFTTLCAFLCHGQQPADDCLSRQTSVDSLIAADNLLLAAEKWDELSTDCKVFEPYFTAGEKILKYRREIASKDGKEEAVLNLVRLYDEYDLKFPGNANGNLINKAIVLHENGLRDRAEIYKLLDHAFTKTPQIFTNAEALYLYFDIYYEKYLSGDSGITAANILNRLADLQGHISRLNLKASPQQRHVFKNLNQSLLARVSEVATCENMVPYFTTRFELGKDDAAWLQNASAMLLNNNCTTDPIFARISEASHALNPTASSAYSMAIVAFRKNDKPEAAKYFEQSAALDPDAYQKAAIYYTIASTIYNTGDRAKAKHYALKAVEVQPDFGKSYLFLAQLYGSSADDCELTPFETKALNWLAAETALKAGIANAKYKAGADKMAENYRKKAPTSAEIKQAKMGGKPVRFTCWINETIVVPKN